MGFRKLQKEKLQSKEKKLKQGQDLAGFSFLGPTYFIVRETGCELVTTADTARDPKMARRVPALQGSRWKQGVGTTR